MIPDYDFIQKHYDGTDRDVLTACRVLAETLDPSKAVAEIRAALRAHFTTEESYIQNTHLISTKTQGVVPFRWNKMQRRFYEDVIQRCRKESRPIRGISTKARQQGQSTFIQSWQFEQLDRMPYRYAMTVNYDQPNSDELFNKAKFIQDTNFAPRETTRDSAGVIQFRQPHGSVFYVRTAGQIDVGRSLTLHQVHASEMPLWPDADTTFTALNQCVPSDPNTSIFKESTARGAVGHHYEQWNMAVDGESDYVPFFSPWYWSDEYTMDFQSKDLRNKFGREMSKRDQDYAERFGLTLEQMHWRSWKIRNDHNGNELLFRQEYPASATEAFLTTGLAVFDAEKIMKIEHDCKPAYWIGDILLSAAGSEPSGSP